IRPAHIYCSYVLGTMRNAILAKSFNETVCDGCRARYRCPDNYGQGAGINRSPRFSRTLNATLSDHRDTHTPHERGNERGIEGTHVRGLVSVSAHRAQHALSTGPHGG